MSVIPCGNRLLLQQKVEGDGDEEIKTKSGLILAAAHQEIKRHPIGKIVAKGALVAEEFQVGDTVLFEGWNGEQVSEELGGQKHLMIIDAHKIIAKYA